MYPTLGCIAYKFSGYILELHSEQLKIENHEQQSIKNGKKSHLPGNEQRHRAVQGWRPFNW
jgi:hypothetical protein